MQHEVQSAENLLPLYEERVRFTQEERDAYKAVYDAQGLSKIELIAKEKELNAAKTELEEQRAIFIKAKNDLESATERLNLLKSERQREILSQLDEKEKAIADLEGEVTKAEKGLEMQQLVSPVNGTVHGLALHTIGGVITPAQPVVTIVPDGTPMIAEASVLNKDIGFIKAGQKVEIKLDTFPFQKYGTIHGKVAFISPDAFDDEKLGPVYNIKVTMDKQYLRVDGRNATVSPGMTTSVEVKTGERRIIEFFLSPIIKYAKESLTLR